MAEIADQLVHRINYGFHMKSRIMYVADYDIITDFWKRPKEGHKHCNIANIYQEHLFLENIYKIYTI